MKIELLKFPFCIKLLFVFASICTISANINKAIGQTNSGKQLAQQYYQDQEYEKAAELRDEIKKLKEDVSV